MKKQVRIEEIDNQNMIIEERCCEIENIKEDVKKLNDIFTRLATIVDKQSIPIERLEDNIIHARQNVTSELDHLEEADRLHKNNTFCLF